MSKDPAFLFYPKDWLEGTAEMSPEEKGVYIDLLCYQHQRGFIPSDTLKLSRMVGLPIKEFNIVWGAIKIKFNQMDNQMVDRLVNSKLLSVTTDRINRGHKNRISGIFATLIRKSDLTQKEINDIKKRFKTEEFIQFSKEDVTDRLTEWFTKNRTPERSESIEDENANKDLLICPLEKDVIKYFVENGFPESLGKKAFDYYNVAKWKDSKGKQVKNWKQKMQGVWFKDENKAVINMDNVIDTRNHIDRN